MALRVFVLYFEVIKYYDVILVWCILRYFEVYVPSGYKFGYDVF